MPAGNFKKTIIKILQLIKLQDYEKNVSGKITYQLVKNKIFFYLK